MEKQADPQGYQTKVTRLGNGQYGVRLLKAGKVLAEGRADCRRDVGPVLKDLLRWDCKMGGHSEMAQASRSRQKGPDFAAYMAGQVLPNG